MNNQLSPDSTLRIVMKFGGTSVANAERMRHAACHIAREVNAGHKVAVVVSAMGTTTDTLAAQADQAGNGSPYLPERDAVLASGENLSSALLAITLRAMGIAARSWQGWQAGIALDNHPGAGRITAIDAGAVARAMDTGAVAVLAGFQGITTDGVVATMGRGGSDLTAVAMAVALRADRCDIYTDVDGVFTADPRVVAEARKLDRVSFEEMLEMASLGAQVMHARAMALAMARGVRVRVRRADDDPAADQGRQASRPGTLICPEEEIMEQRLVSGVAYSRGQARISLRGLADKPGIAEAVFSCLADADVNVDMIIQNVSQDGEANMTFTLARESLETAMQLLHEARAAIGFQKVIGEDGFAKVSVVGVGMRAHAGVAQVMFQALAREKVNIEAIATSEIRISVLIAERYVELAARALHEAYGLDAIDA